jgi:hypothetical protein
MHWYRDQLFAVLCARKAPAGSGRINLRKNEMHRSESNERDVTLPFGHVQQKYFRSGQGSGHDVIVKGTLHQYFYQYPPIGLHNNFFNLQ